ncbi:MAG: hypothetical protein ACWGQW_03825 [bacterium]
MEQDEKKLAISCVDRKNKVVRILGFATYEGELPPPPGDYVIGPIDLGALNNELEDKDKITAECWRLESGERIWPSDAKMYDPSILDHFKESHPDVTIVKVSLEEERKLSRAGGNQ